MNALILPPEPDLGSVSHEVGIMWASTIARGGTMGRAISLMKMDMLP